MTSIGTGYDYSVGTYSPEGRVFQVEYAAKAVESSGTAIGLRVKDGVVLAVEKIVQSKLLVPGSNRRIHGVDRHVGMATAGLLADGKHLINRARDECSNYHNIYKCPIPGKIIANRVGMYTQAYTLYSSVRPFGSTAIIGAMDHEGPQLYMVEPSGLYWGYRGCATGKGHKVAKTELEKLNLEELTVEEAVDAAAKIILIAHDEAKDKHYEVEISWISEKTNFTHQIVPKERLDRAIQKAEAELEEDDEDDE
ncbi:N-terminal nucleophile aminohydrolase [Conidiobolus coronatus NRRL 28638]|uniref:N-terminal nucleophile aminohydrolase n=1 Tax=Conidiobolus coronatus (strain ATCC 28846 / CBS 209.66 / NRRL 28638) TaxID=796925 RepID=A0A137P849_CONC2|nr:N-terminal nucleophile aminohydrolase [Conidiobolus coronatus NRRL 28638]|eukprot:KXN71149.1 N-terminal nucleophile aminohydrolase [Conidiobolus coronatus NRRL 28638]